MALTRRDYFEGKSEHSARDVFFYYTGPQPSAVRYKNWKFYYTMVPDTATGAFMGASTFHWTQIGNILRDPFEIAVGNADKTALGYGGALAGPSTAYIYNWNILPIGQLLWLKELQSYVRVPADAGSGELQPGLRFLQQVKREGAHQPSD